MHQLDNPLSKTHYGQIKGVADMAIIYAYLIIKGKKTLADVPAKLKDQVKQCLVDLDCPDLATE